MPEAPVLGVPFSLPGPEALSERVEPLLDAIYAAFTLARDDCGVAELEGEALWLGRLVAELAPDEPEADGLLSLMLFASKHALEAWSESLDHEVRTTGVRSILIEPGFTASEISSHMPEADAALAA